jgi:aminoglycoside phosphotransferase (APT) family kinase protein
VKVLVDDPFGAAKDPNLPTLPAALDPDQVKAAFKRGFPRLTGNGFVVPKAIRVTRYKPGRRAVVEYDVRIEEDGRRIAKAILIGKVRARRSGNEGYRLLEAIWNAGFETGNPDKVCVPEPVGVIPAFQMWFQRKVSGAPATGLLAGPEGISLSKRIAKAIHKLHQANVPTERRHTMGDELRILRECLSKVEAQNPEWSSRIERLWQACERIDSGVNPPRFCGVHRDFYPAQVLVRKSKLWLIDFDLYCVGDPGLDIGNFLGHMTEQSLRELGDANLLAGQERALEEEFLKLAGAEHRASIHAYTVLTLARHVYLSTQFPERQRFTETLLRLCEQRLGLQS